VPPENDPVSAVAAKTLKENISFPKWTDIREGHSLAIVGTGHVAQALAFFCASEGHFAYCCLRPPPLWRNMFLELGADEYVSGDNFPPLVRKVLAR